MFRVFAAFAAVFSVMLLLPPFAACPAQAQQADYRAAFMHSVRGAWSGKGSVVAGRYKGVKFSCNFTAPSAADAGDIELSGSCRSGIFSQPIKAAISRKGGTLQGSFNEGAQANGMDITAGRVEKDSMTLELNREKLRGRMTAQLEGENRLHITLAVTIDDEAIPVIGMDLTRAEPPAALASAKSAGLFAWLGN